mgnify:FL=1|tara:strand:+ start:998 stop:1201 length:204 start_codon:yes stop_codon:yes gene_type:complete
MSTGFGGDVGDGKAKVIIQQEEIQKLIKEYKQIKKYMKSPLYEIKNLSGTERRVKDLLDTYGQEDDT